MARDVPTPPTRPLDPRLARPDDHDSDDAGAPTRPRTGAALGAIGDLDGGRYEMRDLLGRGGMGEVWLALDRRIGREVAVKLARPDASDQEGLARFLREARLQGQLDHPAVVPVHDLGSADRGTVFFTMKRVRGETLATILTRLSEGDAAAIERYRPRKLLTAFLQVCHAVEVAHARGLVHRDLKPGNIMLGDHGEVHVLDWGLAKVARVADVPSTPSPPSDDGAALTVAGQFLGTPGYMAPEQGRGESVDGRADVYALGATLFEILTLTPLVPRGPTQVVLAATQAGVDARASLRGTIPVAPELETVCVRATATRLADRYQRVAELREAVERYLDGDRDLERRRVLAEAFTSEATQLAARAAAGDEESRAAALSALGRALALEPAHVAAQHLLMELMVTPPRRTPAAVASAVEASQDAAYTAVATAGAWIYLLWLPIALVMVWMGIKRVDPLLGWVGFTLATAMTMFYARARGRQDPVTYFAGLVLSCAAIAISSRVTGTMILTPTLFTMNTVGFVVAARRAWLWPTLVIASAALVGPFLFEALGWVEPTTVVDGGAVQVTSAVVEFRDPQASVAAVGVSVVFLIMVTSAAGRIRQRFLEQTRKAELATWQLRQLVPRMEHGSSPSSRP